MRRLGLAVLMALTIATPAAGQEDEVFVDSFEGAPELRGYVDDGVVVLDDRSYCAYVFGSAFGSGRHIDTDILRWELRDNGLNRRAVNDAIREHGSQPITDGLLLDACAYSLSQFRNPDVSYFEFKYPDDPQVAEFAPEPPEWQAMPVLPASVMESLSEREAER